MSGPGGCLRAAWSLVACLSPVAARGVRDVWTGANLGRHEGTFTVRDLPAHSGRLLVCEP